MKIKMMQNQTDIVPVNPDESDLEASFKKFRNVLDPGTECLQGQVFQENSHAEQKNDG